MPGENLFVRNRTKLMRDLEDDALAVLFSSQRMPRNGDQYFPFRQDSNFFYLTGTEQPGCILLLNTSEAFLFINEPTSHMAIWEGIQLDAPKAQEISGIENIRWTRDFENVLNKLLVNHKIVYFNLPEKIPAHEPRSQDAEYLEKFRNNYPFHDIQSLRPFLEKLRLKKEPEELEYIKQAIHITQKAVDRVLQLLKPGMGEKAVEAEITRQMILGGAKGFAFDPILASGKNATVLHYTSNHDVCRKQELLLMDFGAEYRNYAADISRTLPVEGRFTSRQRECYQAVLDIMQELMPEIKPGVTIAELQQKVVSAFKEKHRALGLYSAKDIREDDTIWKKYFPHGISHFMGLDVHDCGDKNTVLEKGMVISWEPGIYIAEEGIGIRIEDDILVDDTPVNLSQDIPKDPDQLEKLMQEKHNP